MSEPAPPVDIGAMRLQARVLRSAGRYEEALRLLTAALRLAPGDRAVMRALVETRAAAAIAAGDWPALSRAWATVAGGLAIRTGVEPGLPAPLVRMTIGGGRLTARLPAERGTSPSDSPVIVALRLLRPTRFWLAIDRTFGRPVTVLVDPTDGDGPARTLPHLAGSSRCDLAIPIPDFDFLGEAGYAALLARLEDVPWPARRPVALWRGAPTGEVPASGDAADLPRVRLCRIAAASGGRIDAGLHRLVDLERFPPGTQTALEPLLRPLVATSSYPRWRYQIYIDGHANAWSGMFQRLATGSAVLKVESAAGWRQWYYDRLVPWRTVVPVASDLSDLVDKVDWLRRNDEFAAAIGRAGQALVRALDLDSQLAEGMQAVRMAEQALIRAEGQGR
ncbi:glycosyl transferase family 90 [Stella sp.]|uniref:glycosyl transferase family 90 n=1 Tax=Stella sp. TaxID=2912054 RepID=UPI0035ADCC2F